MVGWPPGDRRSGFGVVAVAIDTQSASPATPSLRLMHRIWRSTWNAGQWIGGIEFAWFPGRMQRVTRRRWIIGGGVALLCLIGAVVGTWLSTRGPVFRGKTESEWVAEIRNGSQGPITPDTDPIRDRFVEMGTEVVLFLGKALVPSEPSRPGADELAPSLHRSERSGGAEGFGEARVGVAADAGLGIYRL
jgi:hypothetical protein